MPKRATRQQIATTIGLLLAIVAAGYWWGPHIWWSYLVGRNKLKLDPVKVVAMPKVEARSGWFHCQADAVSFQLPQEMADEADRAVSKKSPQTLTLTSRDYEVSVLIPYEIPAGQTPVFKILADQVGLSPIQLIVESYRSGTDDFRWTMTHSELKRHQLLLDLSRNYPHQDALFVETWSDDDLEGMFAVHKSKSQAMFEWRLKSGKATGFLRFSAAKRELNLDDIRWCCQSLKCDTSLLKPELSADQLAVLADSMKIELDVLPAQRQSEKSAAEK